MPTQAACQQCGVPVAAGAHFCANCGADVSAEQGSAPTRRMRVTPAMIDELLVRVRDAALGEYEILTELGRGGMATVYLAHDIQLDRKVALKVMLPSLLDGEDMVERFRLEARTAAQLSHPHIIPIYAVRAADHLVYFVMKFVEGRPLDAIIQELGPLPIPMVQSILSRVGDALGYAHRKGVVHRDIKPANLMIDVEGMPIVTDFGIAKVADARGLTMTGAMIGTPTYMSPEQCSAGEITGASDQYSLGVVAYQMIAGKVPFESDSIVGLLYKHVHEPPDDLVRVRPDCPPSLAAAVRRMLAKDPKDRYPSMEAAVEAIGSITLAYDDPIRTQLVGLAKQGRSVAALRRVSTPRSPTPVRSPRSGATRSGATRSAAPTAAAAEPAPASAPAAAAGTAAPRRAFPFVGGGALAVVAGLLLWMRPWATEAPPVDPEAGADASRAVAPAAVTPEPQRASGPDSAALASASGDSTGLTAADPTVTPPSTAGAGAGRAESAPAAIRIANAPAALTVGDQVTLRATVVDARGAALGGRPVAWTSLDPSRATVSAAGVVSARAPGEATIVARIGDVRQQALIRIDPVRAATVTVSGAPASLLVGATARLVASPVDAQGREVATGIAWRSSDPRVASVVDGLVTAVAPGTAVVLATADGREGAATIRVTAPEPAAVTPPAPAPAREEAPPPDPRALVDDVIQRYARALESRQLSAVRAVYPGITPQQEAQVTQMRGLERLRVVLRVGALNVVGEEATAAVSGAYEFYSPENRRTEQLPVSFTATLVRGSTGWQIRSIR